jgi:valyl-tRNA synthetase
MSQGALPKGYEFTEVEAHWYRYWEERNFFRADETSRKPPYSIVIPPPNVTGQLHMGHALNNTLQDILCRYKRLKGFEVLWVPGRGNLGLKVSQGTRLAVKPLYSAYGNGGQTTAEL